MRIFCDASLGQCNICTSLGKRCGAGFQALTYSFGVRTTPHHTMHDPHSHHESGPTEAEIQKAAYYIWLAGGCLPGHDLENWLAAKEYLKHHHGRAARAAGTKPEATHHLNTR